DGMNLFAPRLDDLQPYFEFEFQVYPYLVAVLYQVFGVAEWLGRLTAVLFSLGTMGYLYGLGKRYLDRTSALVAVSLFAVLPMAVYYNRAFMPESTLLFFSVAGLYHFDRWRAGGRERDSGLAAGGSAGPSW
ncbi:MAG: ArnT family glycosyltransferase, partial [Nitrospinota bacterium]